MVRRFRARRSFRPRRRIVRRIPRIPVRRLRKMTSYDGVYYAKCITNIPM